MFNYSHRTGIFCAEMDCIMSEKIYDREQKKDFLFGGRGRLITVIGLEFQFGNSAFMNGKGHGRELTKF